MAAAAFHLPELTLHRNSLYKSPTPFASRLGGSKADMPQLPHFSTNR
jgi:hypothetical protein